MKGCLAFLDECVYVLKSLQILAVLKGWGRGLTSEKGWEQRTWAE